MKKWIIALLVVALGASISFIACGGGSGSQSVEEYAAAFCDNSDWANLDTEYETWGDIKSAMRDARDYLDELNPPEELAAYHRETRGLASLFIETIDEYDDDDPFSATEMLGSIFVVGLAASAIIEAEEEKLSQEIRKVLAEAGCDIDEEANTITETMETGDVRTTVAATATAAPLVDEDPTSGTLPNGTTWWIEIDPLTDAENVYVGVEDEFDSDVYLVGICQPLLRSGPSVTIASNYGLGLSEGSIQAYVRWGSATPISTSEWSARDNAGGNMSLWHYEPSDFLRLVDGNVSFVIQYSSEYRGQKTHRFDVSQMDDAPVWDRIVRCPTR